MCRRAQRKIGELQPLATYFLCGPGEEAVHQGHVFRLASLTSSWERWHPSLREQLPAQVMLLRFGREGADESTQDPTSNCHQLPALK